MVDLGLRYFMDKFGGGRVHLLCNRHDVLNDVSLAKRRTHLHYTLLLRKSGCAQQDVVLRAHGRGCRNMGDPYTLVLMGTQ